MNLITRDPWRDLDKVFDGFFSPSRSHTGAAESGEQTFAPRVDIHERDDAYEISAELPGVKKDALVVKVEDGVLSITASKQQAKTEEDGRVLRRECVYGKYQRSFSLGDDVDEDSIEASFADGLLHLVVSKAQPQQPQAKEITIN